MTAKELGQSIAGLAMLGFIGLLVYACNQGEQERKERDETIAASTDPREISSLVLGPGSDATATRVGDKLIITYRLHDNFTGSMMLVAFHQDAIDLIPKIFKQVADVEEIEMRANATLVDVRGNSSNELVARLEVSRTNSGRTNWPNVLHDNVPRVVDDYWVHPAMTR